MYYYEHIKIQERLIDVVSTLHAGRKGGWFLSKQLATVIISIVINVQASHPRVCLYWVDLF